MARMAPIANSHDLLGNKKKLYFGKETDIHSIKKKLITANMNMKVRTPVSDPNIEGGIKAKFNLASVKDVIPMEEGDAMNGNITATEASNQIYWTNRQINRYLNKYVGVSLKKYLLIQKCYQSYLQIRKGDFYPDKGFYDQPHFIREIKKHTGETPTSLNEKQNDRFIQLTRIIKK